MDSKVLRSLIWVLNWEEKATAAEFKEAIGPPPFAAGAAPVFKNIDKLFKNVSKNETKVSPNTKDSSAPTPSCTPSEDNIILVNASILTDPAEFILIDLSADKSIWSFLALNTNRPEFNII